MKQEHSISFIPCAVAIIVKEIKIEKEREEQANIIKEAAFIINDMNDQNRQEKA